MTIDQALRTRLEALFSPLRTKAAAKAFPPCGELKNQLESALPQNATGARTVTIAPKVAILFATAAVEMWLRGVHSFLVSTSSVDISPIWSSVSGYYASHYSVRAFAHLLGYFQLFKRKRIVRLQLEQGKHLCSFDRRNAGHREHSFYWRVVKQDPHFSSDPLFTGNYVDQGPSDVAHRDHANYADHLCAFPTFKPLEAEAIKVRIRRISEIEFNAPPIPSSANFPDLESVQVVAYHRIVRFRRFLDDILSAKNRFWAVHREPGWAAGFIDFQLTEPGGLSP
jgi:hypothetical protein